MNKQLVIAGVEITTDSEGRFNLNALHRASGGAKKDRPSYWLALESTQALIKELENQLRASDAGISASLVVSSKGGVDQGTFAHELLAISYAGWIGPRFQLQVNQVFLDYKTGKLTQPHTHPSIPDASAVAFFSGLADMLIERVGVKTDIAMASALNAMEKATGLDLNDYRKLLPGRTEPVETLNATQVGQLIGVSARTANKMLEMAGLQCKNRSGKWELTEQGMQYGAAYPYERNGHADYQIRWGTSVVKQLAARH